MTDWSKAKINPGTNRDVCRCKPGACGRCSNGCDPGYLGCNPNRENPPWQRCWHCGALWDGNGADLLAKYPDLVMKPADLVD